MEPMATGVRVQLSSAARRALLTDENGTVAQELERACIRVQTAATRLCPVDTGRLRASIDYSVERDGDGLVGIVGTNVEYAPFVELGTYRTRAQPFLRPALAAAVRR